MLGRHIYAVGGNPEAAELSGIRGRGITHVVFGSMGMLAALSGMLFATRLRSATTTADTLFELDAIAADFVSVSRQLVVSEPCSVPSSAPW